MLSVVSRCVSVQYRWVVDELQRYSLVFAGDPSGGLLCAALPGSHHRVNSRAEFVAAARRRRPAVAFVDAEVLTQIEGETAGIPIIALINGTLAETLRSLNTFPWVSSLLSATMLSTPLASPHLAMLLERLRHGPGQPALAAAAVGRQALLASSIRREVRFERMREYFSQRGVSPRVTNAVLDIAEELVTNALYDAPVEAGYFKQPVPRTSSVELPPEHACEISYGIEQGCAFARVRDPFGALSRTRLLGVLNRCSATCVSLDESRGGAGLGLWRVFSTASTIAITVLPGRLTDILVRVEMKKGRSIGKQILAVHLFFPEAPSLDGAQGRFAADHDHDLVDESFTASQVA
jgi:hypothetical protein